MVAMHRIGWEPAVYEHKAALLARPVIEVSRSAELLAAATVAEFEAYRADAVVASLDLYNVEAEALGVAVRDLGPEACPDLEDAPAELPAPLTGAPRSHGRFATLLDGATRARDALAGRTCVRVGVSGPASLACRLLGMERFLMGLALDEPEVGAALELAESTIAAWVSLLRESGLEVAVFDSMASPPNVSPDGYRGRLKSAHARLMSQLARSGQTRRPLICGGDTTAIARDLAETGATYLVCDFPADAGRFAAAVRKTGVDVRRNINPAAVTLPCPPAELTARTRRDLDLFERPILGTGVLPYRTDPAHVRALRDAVLGE